MTSDILPPDDFQDDFGDDALAAEYALGLLTGAAHADAMHRSRSDPAFAIQVNAWQDRFADLTEAIAPVTPPRGVFKNIRRAAYGDSGQSWFRQLGIIPAIVGGAAAAMILYVSIEFGMFNGTNAPVPTLVAQMVAADETLVVAAAYTDDGTLFVERRVGASAQGRALELWLIAGEDAPVSLGLLASSAALDQIVIPAGLRDKLAGATLAISDEPEGGSPTGAPTGAVLAAGEITTL